MTERNDGDSKPDSDDALREAAAEVAKAAALLSLPRNTPNIDPPDADRAGGPRAEPLRALPRPPHGGASASAARADKGPETIELNAESSTIASEPPRRANRFILLAASVAAAAVLGSVAGSLATAGLTDLMAPKAQNQDAATVRALKQTVAQLGAEVTSLKASVEAVNRTNTTQYAHINERFDRVEHAQADPAAKLAKITEQLDRLEHRPAAAPASPADTTGAVSDNRVASAAATAAPPPAVAAPPETRPARPPTVDGWILRGVYRGRALIESRYGQYEVIPGSNLPGLGVVEDVVRQDGRWIVVTQKGVITSMR